MSLPNFTLTVDGLSRTTSYRNNGGTLKDAVIWCHGGGGTGQAFLENKIEVRSGVIDYGPDALVLVGTECPDHTWVGPGEPWGSCVPNTETDIRYMDALVARIKTDHPGIRIWMGGFSSGAKNTWNVYGYNADSNFPNLADISGFGIGSFGEPTSWVWTSKTKTPKPAALWYGTSEPNPIEGAKTFVASAIDLGSLHGCTGQTSWHSLGQCCGKDLQRQEGISCTADFWYYKRVGGIHVWSDCSGCHEDDHFVQLWANNGFGT